MQSLLLKLTPEESQKLLYIITKEEPHLVKMLEEKAQKHFLQVNTDQVAVEVYSTLNALELEDIIHRPGPKRFKYMEPVDAAFEVVGEAMEPFAFHLQRLIDLEKMKEFQQLACGIWKGIQAYLKESDSEILNYIQDDAPEWFHGLLLNYAETVESSEEKQLIEQLLAMLFENEG